MMENSTVFNWFCTQDIASLLSQAGQQLQVQLSQRVAEQQTMNSPLAWIIKKEPLAVTPETPVRQVVEQMATRSIGSMIIVDNDRQPIGIFTQSDEMCIRDRYYENVGGSRCPVVDTFWQTETGGHMITPLPGVTPMVPGSCTLPFPGIQATVVDETGTELDWGKGGLLVVSKPWPAMIRTIWNLSLIHI